MSCTRLWRTASITEQLSSPAIPLSSPLPARTAGHAAEVIHGTAVPLRAEREQKAFPVSLDWIGETTAGNASAAHCSSTATELSSSVDVLSIDNLSNESKQLSSAILTTEGVQMQFEQKKKSP